MGFFEFFMKTYELIKKNNWKAYILKIDNLILTILFSLYIYLWHPSCESPYNTPWWFDKAGCTSGYARQVFPYTLWTILIGLVVIMLVKFIIEKRDAIK